MHAVRYILALCIVFVIINDAKAEDNEFLSIFQTNVNKRARNLDIDYLVSARITAFAALGEITDVTYAYEYEGGKDRHFGYWSPHGLSSPPEKSPEMAARRLEYLSLWLATIKPEETVKGNELKDSVIVIGRETGAYDSNEIPGYLFNEMSQCNKSVFFGLKEVSPNIVNKAISNLVIWRKDNQIFYQEAKRNKEVKEERKLWEDINTLNLPKNGPFYIIVDVGIGEKGKKQILDRFENHRKFQKQMEKIEKRTTGGNGK